MILPALLSLCLAAEPTISEPVIPVLRITVHLSEAGKELYRETESIYVPVRIWIINHGPLTEVDLNTLKKQCYLREVRFCCFVTI